MSIEFWYGAMLTFALFFPGVIVSVFAEDIRGNLKSRWKNRKLRGAALRLKRLRSELADLDYYNSYPAASSAMFWSGFYLFVALLMLLCAFSFMAFQLQAGWARIAAIIFLALLWSLTYGLVMAAHRKAERLAKPDKQIKFIQEQIAIVEASMDDGHS